MEINFKLILLFFVIGSANAQVGMRNLEDKAVLYLCDSILKQDEQLSNIRINFKGCTNGKSSKIYDIADCIGDINLIKDSIPNRVYLDSLEREFTKKRYSKKRIANTCKKINYSTFFRKSTYRMHLYHAIEYKNNYYVEIYLINKLHSTYTISIQFDKEFEIIGCFTSSLVY